MTKGASSVTVVTLLDKPARRTKPIAADLAGFEVPDEFVVATASTTPRSTAICRTSACSSPRFTPTDPKNSKRCF